MAKPPRVLGVFKFGARRHMEEFSKGLLYMNTLQYFAEIEAHALRKDSREGTSYMMQADGALLEVGINETFQPVGEIRGPLRYRHPDTLKVNVFCMYALRENATGSLLTLVT